jgi:AcrR family transcriptional regulator
MNLRERQIAETRRAILDAVAAVLVESGMDGFTIQAVADRVGVTHRTVYNYFPTREALNDAFAEHLEALGAEQGIVKPERDADVASLPEVAGQLGTWFGPHAAHIEAYVMMMIASRAPARVFRERSKKMEKLIDDELGPLDPGVAKLVTAAIRMFLSSMGWFLLSKHHGLSPTEVGRVSQWAVKALLDTAKRGDVPKRLDKGGKKNA